MASHVDRLQNLEKIEREIASALDNAGLVMAELGKDKPNNKNAEAQTQAFLKTVNSIERELMKQINHLTYVVTSHPHTGSSYGALKDYQMSCQKMEHVASRLDDLEKLKVQVDQHSSLRQSELRRALSHQQAFPTIGAASNTNTQNLT